MKYYAVNIYPYTPDEESDVWIEEAEADSLSKATEKLARNNPQFILSETEMKRLKEEISGID